MQKKKSTRALLGALALLASTAAWAGTEVRFDKPQQFTDVPFDQRQREEVLKDLGQHFEKLGQSLPSGQTLKIDVTDVDLAGREEPRLRGANDLRVLNGRADWPRLSLRYVLEQDGKVIRSGAADLSDMSYMSRINRYAGDTRLRYEKQMIDDWFAKTFGTPAKGRARK